MIKFEHTEVMGWEHVIRGMRNPMNSWEMSDSFYEGPNVPIAQEVLGLMDTWGFNHKGNHRVGPNDLELMMKLAKGGPVHAKYRRMITVYVDITAPLYWWKEFDTYKVGTVANSTSTMHKIHEKKFTWKDFSVEHLMNFGAWMDERGEFTIRAASHAHAKIMGLVIESLNGARERFLEYSSRGGSYAEQAKLAWWQMIQLLPSSYNQKRTIMMNYEVLTGIYPMRKDHKLDEWHDFCDWLEGLPYSEIMIGEAA